MLTTLCEHAPFDLVASRDGAFLRVSVKSRTLSSNGALKVFFISTWSDSNGTHKRPIGKDEVDVLCVSCPETRSCCYVDPKAFGTSVSLRVRPSRNGQIRNVLFADQFRDVPVGLACPAVETGRRTA